MNTYTIYLIGSSEPVHVTADCYVTEPDRILFINRGDQPYGGSMVAYFRKDHMAGLTIVDEVEQ